jgi:hypothetical protein
MGMVLVVSMKLIFIKGDRRIRTTFLKETPRRCFWHEELGKVLSSFIYQLCVFGPVT